MFRRKNLTPLWQEFREDGLTAFELLRRFSIDAPAIPVVALANSMGVEVYSNKMPQDGALEMDLERGVAQIFVHQDAPRNLQRFTVAHEIGHLMLHTFEGQIHHDTRGQFNSPIEQEANQYAAELLMPEWMVRFAAREFGADVQQLASLFEVSERAMTIRLSSLGFSR